MTCCNIFTKFEAKKNLIKEYNHWILLIRNRHKTLGSCLAIAKEHHALLSELSQEEMAEYAQVVKDIERALKKAFNYEHVQHLLLMAKEKHVHFNVFPRYKENKDFAGVTFPDDFPDTPHPLGIKNLPINQGVLDQIKEEIQKHL